MDTSTHTQRAELSIDRDYGSDLWQSFATDEEARDAARQLMGQQDIRRLVVTGTDGWIILRWDAANGSYSDAELAEERELNG
jgi:hypothetical protein